MKEIFGIWLEPVENFVKTVSEMCTEPGIPLEDMMNWMHTEGAMLFQRGQSEYFERVKDQYLNKPKDKRFDVKFDYAHVQIEVGFNNVFQGLLEKFPGIHPPTAQEFFLAFKEAFLSEKYYPYIAARAVMTEPAGKQA